MNSLICASCRASLRKASQTCAIPSIRTYSSSSTSQTNPEFQEPTRAPTRETQTFDIGAFLSKPSWSVRSLLPDPKTPLKEEITPKQLHHLLRLSALPQPKSPEEEAQMLKTLHTQLHFVRDIQSVDTEGIEPLQSIRDETTEGIEEATIGLRSLRKALKKEFFGKRNGRPRSRVKEEVVKERTLSGMVDRNKTPVVMLRGESRGWDVMATANDKIVTPNGSYFVVRSGKVESSVKVETKGSTEAGGDTPGPEEDGGKIGQPMEEGDNQGPEKVGDSPP